MTFVRISGLGLPGRPWSLDANRDIIGFCIDIFGPKRAMFASNFPVDRLCGSFDTIFSGFDAATRDQQQHAQDITPSRWRVGQLDVKVKGTKAHRFG